MGDARLTDPSQEGSRGTSPRRGSSGLALAAVIVLAAIALASLPRAGAGGDACSGPVDHPDWSVARRWNEVTLDAIRRDLPAPTVHARNLHHSSAAMWDAWAAYDPSATGHLVTEKHDADDPAAAREVAMSHAAFGVLEARYLPSVGAEASVTAFRSLMAALCLDPDGRGTDGDSPEAVGNRIAAAYLEFGLADGSNEAGGYEAPDYAPVNPPLVVDETGTTMTDPNRWQPLQIARMVSQNGIPVDDGVQEFIDPHWGGVTPFAIAPDPAGLPIDPGPPPRLGDAATDQAFKDAAVEVIRFSATLDPAAGRSIDISPGAQGANPLGTYDGRGHAVNPVTSAPYEPNVVDAADFGRALAEFWADGPDSETPPGHWNTLANTVSDSLGPDLRIGGTGEPVDRLEWDTKLYLVLNGANHDAAVAAWGAKGHYDYVRPISAIRHLGGLGQSSDPDGPAYHPDGLPLVPGLVEVVTVESARAGQRHAALAGHVGAVAVRAWTGVPDDPETEVAGVDWILAGDWVPYQQPTFVTPAFAGYVSGHSTFSRASAEVLARFTGSEFFPEGLGEWVIEAGSLDFEAGPTRDVALQWATYADAADQAGISRLYGGIHVRADDLAGRIMGASVGRAAWERAVGYWG